jgi:hypothetical protein
LLFVDAVLLLRMLLLLLLVLQQRLLHSLLSMMLLLPQGLLGVLMLLFQVGGLGLSREAEVNQQELMGRNTQQ